MASCSFFGSSKGNFVGKKEFLRKIILDLINTKDVVQFYCGGRGAFDEICSSVVGEIRKDYPHIKNTQVLSYLPKEDFILNEKYTDSVYLLERYVPPRYAILETNKLIVQKSDFIIVSTKNSFGGARTAREYAEKKGKIIIDIDEEKYE